MAYIYQDGLIDGQGVSYWHKQYINSRNICDQLETDNTALQKQVERLREVLFGTDGVLEWLEGESEPWATEREATIAYNLRRRIEALEAGDK